MRLFFECARMWQAAEDYFESLDDAHMVLPGGRYSCAQALVSRGLDFLHKRSLGQVCHIVQLAISQKKLGKIASILSHLSFKDV